MIGDRVRFKSGKRVGQTATVFMFINFANAGIWVRTGDGVELKLSRTMLEHLDEVGPVTRLGDLAR